MIGYLRLHVGEFLGGTVGQKSHYLCFHKKYAEAGVMTYVAHYTWVSQLTEFLHHPWGVEFFVQSLSEKRRCYPVKDSSQSR